MQIGEAARAGAALWVLALVLELAVGAAAVWLAGQHGPALVGVALNLLIAVRFATTLWTGRVPLITRYARADMPGLPPEAERYTRRLTIFWAWLLGGAALVHAGAAYGLWATGTVAVLQAVLFPALFLGEHVVRNRLLPQLGRSTPQRTLRAIALSFTSDRRASRHGA